MKKIVFNLFLILLTCHVSAQEVLWVSHNGSGATFSETSPGSLTGTDLKNKVKSLRNNGVKNIRVIVKEGLYQLSEPITVNDEWASNITDTLSFTGIASDPCSNTGKAIISGGKKITGWQSAGNGVYTAQLPAGTTIRQLFVNGKLAIRARHPNRESDTDQGPFWRVKNLVYVPGGASYFAIDSSEVKQWRNMSDVEISVHQDWVHSYVKVNSFEMFGKNARVYPNSLPPYTWGDTNLPYYWENSPDFLDAEDEWYFDKSTNILSYKPRAEENINQIEVIYPVMNRLLTIEGTTTNPVRNVTIQNIEFIYGKWAVGNIRSNQAVQPMDGGGVEALVQVSFADNVRFANCNIFCSGGNGIVFATGVKNSVFDACHFDQICANAILIDDYRGNYLATTQPEWRLCSDNKVTHNLIENFSMNFANGLGLVAWHVDRLTIEHNEIRNGRYSGLQICNGNDIMHDNLIRYNNVHHVMWLHNDGGGIYTMSDQPGTLIAENWVHDMGRAPWVAGSSAAAIFMDDHSAHILVENNVFNSLWSVQKVRQQGDVGPDRNAHDNTVRNNDSQDVNIMANAGLKKVPGIIPSGTLSDEASLSALSFSEGILTPAFNANTLNYTLRVGSDVGKVKIALTAKNCNATILNNPREKQLAEGENPIDFTVMAPNGTTKKYQVNIKRDYAPTLLLAWINDKAINVHDTIKYIAICGEDSAKIALRTSQYCTSQLLFGDKPVETMPVALKPGLNRFTVHVAPIEDYMPTKDYFIEITKPLDIIRPYYDRIMALNLNPATNGGFTFSAFQWKKNGINIDGETGAYLYFFSRPIDTDEYTVTLTTNDGQILPVCSKSGQILRQVPENTLRAFPNPAQSSITVENTDWENASDITLYNKTGIKLQMYPVSGFQTEINVSAYPSGTYIMQSGNKSTIIIIK
jgi:hypothetical protein